MFAKDNRTENFLTHLGADWKYSNNMTFDKLAPGWDSQNLGRSQNQVDDAILEYAEREAGGSAAPAPVLRETAKGLTVLDGVQRLCATRINDTTIFPAYIVDTDSDKLALLIRVTSNHALAGHPEPVEWARLNAAQLLCIEQNMTPEEVARATGFKAAKLAEDVAYLTWSFAIRQIGGPQKMTRGVVLTIAEYAKMDDFQVAPKPVAAFCDALVRGRFSNGQAQEPVKRFFGEVNRKHRKAMHDQFHENLDAFLNEEETRTRLEGRLASRRTPEIKLRAVLRSALTITEELLKEKTRIAYVEEFHQILNQIRGNVTRLGGRKPKVLS